MAVFETWLKSDLKKPVTVKQLPGVVFSQDSKANKVGVIVTDDGEPAELAGTVYGYVIKPNGTTVEVAGVIDSEDSSRAYFVMPQEAYAVGHISIVIKLSSTGSVITTLAACTAYVYQSRKGSGVVPTGTVIPDLQTLETVIADATSATTAANTAATAANTAAANVAGAIADLKSTITSEYSSSSSYSKGDYVTHEGVLYRCTTSIYSPETWTSGHWTPVTVGQDLTEAKNDLKKKTEIKETTASSVDLDITDNNGNVIARLSGGHIATKNFDSSALQTALNAKQDTLTFDNTPTEDSTNPVTSGGVYDAINNIEVEQDVSVKTTEETEPDLDMTDYAGNVIARLSNGGIITKQFDGRKYTTYSVTGHYNRQELTLTVNKSFKKGDRIVLHVERGAMPWEYGAFIAYYEGNKLISSTQERDSNYLKHTVTANCNSISAVYSSTAFSRELDVEFQVTLLGDVPIEPTVVTIKTDGTGDYTNLRDCLVAIGTSANDVLNPYRIEIYPGTYNVLSDYSSDEISNIHDDDDPTSPGPQEGFVGPKLLNGMSLVGIGDPSEIILNGYLDTTQWAKKYRDEISTLNLQGTSSIENLTVIATNLRYCVHDDWQFNGGKHLHRLVKNCIFRGYNIAYSPYTTYGAGCPISAGYYEFIDCDFGENAGLHASVLQNSRLQCRLVHCKGHGFRIGDSSISEEQQPGKSVYTFINCDFMWINSSIGDTVPHARVVGVGGKPCLYNLPSGMLYNTGDVVIDPRTDLSVGDVVEWYEDTDSGYKWRTATTVDTARGVVVFVDTNDTYIQTDGYVRTDRAGITTFNLGDYIGLSSGNLVVTNDPTAAIGRVAYLNQNGNGFIKLNWRC